MRFVPVGTGAYVHRQRHGQLRDAAHELRQLKFDLGELRIDDVYRDVRDRSPGRKVKV